MTAIVHFLYLKSQRVNIQPELTRVSALLTYWLQWVCTAPACTCTRARTRARVLPEFYSSEALTKTLNIIFSSPQPWKQFSAPFRLLSWKLQTKAFWLHCQILACRGLPIQIRLCSAPRHRLQPASAIVKIAYINALSNCCHLPRE